MYRVSFCANMFWRRLAVSRAIGDAPLKPYVTSDPDIFDYVLKPEDWFIVVASDGIWVSIAVLVCVAIVYTPMQMKLIFIIIDLERMFLKTIKLPRWLSPIPAKSRVVPCRSIATTWSGLPKGFVIVQGKENLKIHVIYACTDNHTSSNLFNCLQRSRFPR